MIAYPSPLSSRLVACLVNGLPDRLIMYLPVVSVDGWLFELFCVFICFTGSVSATRSGVHGVCVGRMAGVAREFVEASGGCCELLFVVVLGCVFVLSQGLCVGRLFALVAGWVVAVYCGLLVLLHVPECLCRVVEGHGCGGVVVLCVLFVQLWVPMRLCVLLVWVYSANFVDCLPGRVLVPGVSGVEVVCN